MSREDIKIVGRTRSILAKHFLELDELHVGCSRGLVRIVGTVQRIGPLKEVMPITKKFLRDLQMEIKRFKEVKRVVFSEKQESE